MPRKRGLMLFMNISKPGLSFLLFALLSSASVFACGFELNDAKASLVDKGVPLFVPRSAFKDEVLERLRIRAGKGKKRLAPRTGSCPSLENKTRKVMEKLLTRSNLNFLLEGEDKLEMFLLCDKQKMPPVGRLSAGRLLLLPASLPLKAGSEDAMAAVIAHEIAHYALAHHARLMTKLEGRSPSLNANWREKTGKIKKGHETEADLAGLKLMSNAGYDTQWAIIHLNKLREAGKAPFSRNMAFAKRRPKLNGHPDPLERALALQRQIQSCGYTVARPEKASTKDVPADV